MTLASAPPMSLAGPTPVPLLGHLLAMWRDPIGLFTDRIKSFIFARCFAITKRASSKSSQIER